LGGIIQGLGGLLGDQPKSTDNAQGSTNKAPTTNAPAQNPLGGLLRAIQGPKENK
jgi:hypothetical protein